MEQTIEELLAQKTPVLYRAAHVSIRQLAEKLRTAMKDASKGGSETKAMQYAYGLPFVKSLKLWVQAVSRSPSLKPLLQPLVVVILSAIRAKESHMIFMPYVAILLGLLNDLSVNCEVFIPITSSCLTAITLCSNKLNSKVLTTEGREPNVTDVVRVSERQLKDRRVVRGLTLLLVKELTRHSAFLGRTSALPEVGWVIIQSLRKISKSNPQFKSEISGLITNLEKSISEVKEKRKNIEGLFQFAFEETSIGKYMLSSITEKQTSTPKEDDEDIEVSEEEEDEDSDSEQEEQVEEQLERSKRSLKRQRQKEKKRQQMMETEPEKLISRVEKKIGNINMKSEVKLFELSDDEE
jgi:nucleolar complex protein 2